jgi:hypothetical protein
MNFDVYSAVLGCYHPVQCTSIFLTKVLLFAYYI